MGVLVEAVWRLALRHDWNPISCSSIDVMQLLGLKYNSSDCWECEIDLSDYDVIVVVEMRLL